MSCGIGKRDVFEVVASGGAGDQGFAMNPVQTKHAVLISSMVDFVTYLGNKGCDVLRARVWSAHVGGCFTAKCVHAL